MRTKPASARRAIPRAALTLLAVAALLAALPPAPAAGEAAPGDCRAGGPWYTDLSGHWAWTYIRVLWWEGVTTAPLLHGLDPSAATWPSPGPYRPDTSVIRPTFGTMLVRVFPGGSFPPPEGALRLAAERSSSGLTRQEAVLALIEALDLGDFARSFDPDAAARYLRQYSDGASVPPAYRQSLAVAIMLGIIRGYPDRTLQPRRLLTRAEAATVIFRSCLLLTAAQPNPFSPDGDGAEDTTTVYLGSLLNRNSREWDLHVEDSSGRILRRLKPPASGPAPPPSLVWAGDSDAGLTLTPGVYYYHGWLKDRDGLVHWSALKPIILEVKSLLGYARPAFVLPGQEVTLSAVAAGGPSEVTARLSSFPAVGALRLAALGESSRDWRTRFSVPAGTAPGPCLVTFTAFYPSATRTATATFTVGRFAVRGEVTPNPVRAGRAVELAAQPNLRPDRVWATVALPAPGGGNVTIALSRAGRAAGREIWRTRWVVPAGTPTGRYLVVFGAALGRSEAWDTVELAVEGLGEELTFILSD